MSDVAGPDRSVVDDLDEGWRMRAACRGMPVERFFAPGEHRPKRGSRAYYEEARAVCGRCPVVEECANEALARGEKFGLWGGLNPVERARARRRRARP